MAEVPRKFGVRQFVPDGRDRMASPHITAMRIMNQPIDPPRFSLEEYLGPVKDQLSLGSCTGFAYAGMREFLYRKYYQWEKDKTVPPAELILSPLFVYYEERVKEGTVDEDGGAWMRTGCKVINQLGVCLESEDPYAPKNFRVEPTPLQRQQALRYKAGAYHRLMSTQEMKSCIASGYVFTMGFNVYPSFYRVGANGIMPVPQSGERQDGGHAVMPFAYDDDTGYFKVRNQWGNSWGEGGNFYMPYEVTDTPGMIQDCWIMHLGPSWHL